MKRLILLFFAAAVVGGYAFAQEVRQDTAKGKPLDSWQGSLVDAKSAPDIVKDPTMAMKNAADYTRATALMDVSRTSGYGLVTAGKWLKFDTAGDQQVADFLKTTMQSKGIMVTVTGRLDGEVLTVSSIKEAAAVDTSSVQ